MSPVLSTFSGASARAFGFGYNFASSAFEHIETQTVGAGGAASVTFSSIPGTYKHLQIRIIARTTRTSYTSDYIDLRANSDSGSNYAYHNLNGDGATAASQSGSSVTSQTISRVASATSGTSIFGTTIIDILDYANTSKFKTQRSLGGVDYNGSGQIYLNSGLWRSSNAITSLSFTASGGSESFVQHSTFALYGIK